jgi:hypothetical protein
MNIKPVATAVDSIMVAAGYGAIDIFQDDADNVGRYFIMITGTGIISETGRRVPSYQVQNYFFNEIPESIHSDQASFLRTFQFSTVPEIWESCIGAIDDMGTINLKNSNYVFMPFIGIDKKSKYIMTTITMSITDMC